MLRFSYEWIEEEDEAHWTECLYGIYDSKLGFSEDAAFAYTVERADAERIVDALNAVEASRRAAKHIFRCSVETDENDLSNLLA